MLDPEGTLRPRTAAAVARAARAGIRPVLCTGRRYRRARPIAAQLALNAPIVCNSGAIVKDPQDDQTLWRADFDPSLAAALLELFDADQRPAVAFTDRGTQESDFIVPGFPTGWPLFDDYVGQNRDHAEVDPSWATEHRRRSEAPSRDALFHLARSAHGTRCWHSSDWSSIAWTAVSRRSSSADPRYLGTMCEILRHDASKWTAVLHLANLWDVDPADICAVGDDVNDVPMIRNAGLGVAMGHAPADVLAAADLVTGDHDEDGVAMLVDEVLLPG